MIDRSVNLPELAHFQVFHLVFHTRVIKTIELDAFKGSALRGAWQAHLRTLYCADRNSIDPLHRSLCPVCYMLNREASPSDNRRPYAFEPPLTDRRVYEKGERFSFGFSIFGQAIQFLPYIILAIQEMGMKQGIGHPIHEGKRRGTFQLESIEEIDPVSQTAFRVYTSGNPVYSPPTHPVTNTVINQMTEQIIAELSTSGNLLTLHFLTPTRIIHQQKLVHRPDFVPLVARAIDRVAMLAAQFSNAKPLAPEVKGVLLSAAQRVEVRIDVTNWWDVKGYSTRLGRDQPLGGFIGSATYFCEKWALLLPWLLWASHVHVGKNAVKGGGWFIISTGNDRSLGELLPAWTSHT